MDGVNIIEPTANVESEFGLLLGQAGVASGEQFDMLEMSTRYSPCLLYLS